MAERCSAILSATSKVCEMMAEPFLAAPIIIAAGVVRFLRHGSNA